VWKGAVRKGSQLKTKVEGRSKGAVSKSEKERVGKAVPGSTKREGRNNSKRPNSYHYFPNLPRVLKGFAISPTSFPGATSATSVCKFRFRRRTQGGWQRYALEAEPRSIYLMTGASRHSWEHSIPPVQKKRYSVTFRTMAASPRATR